jgi:hypothetical protein
MTLADWREQESVLLTASMVAELTPAQKRHVAEYLYGLVSREPLRSGGGWEPERIVLGSLALELDQAAQRDGEPPAQPLGDTRGRTIREREQAFIAFHDRITGMLEHP